MKIRNGFVSNSSSSSFIVKLKHLTGKQISQILRYEEVGVKLGMEEYGGWSISIEDNKRLIGSTSMDNFEMSEYMELIGVKMTKVKWDY